MMTLDVPGPLQVWRITDAKCTAKEMGQDKFSESNLIIRYGNFENPRQTAIIQSAATTMGNDS